MLLSSSGITRASAPVLAPASGLLLLLLLLLMLPPLTGTAVELTSALLKLETP